MSDAARELCEAIGIDTTGKTDKELVKIIQENGKKHRAAMQKKHDDFMDYHSKLEKELKLTNMAYTDLRDSSETIIEELKEEIKVLRDIIVRVQISAESPSLNSWVDEKLKELRNG